MRAIGAANLRLRVLPVSQEGNCRDKTELGWDRTAQFGPINDQWREIRLG